MKTKDLSSLKSKTPAEIGAMVSDIRSQISMAKLEMATRKIKNTNIVKNLRNTLAQILTVKKQKELSSN